MTTQYNEQACQRQVGPGASAAVLVLVANIIWNLASGLGVSFVSIIVAVIFAVALGLRGGFIGKLIWR